MTRRFTSQCFLYVVVAALWCSAFCHGQDESPPQQSSAIDRLIADLVLSEPQAVALRRMYGELDESRRALETEWNTELRSLSRKVQLEYRPELDPDFDISSLSREEQFNISQDRRSFERGGWIIRDLDATNRWSTVSDELGKRMEDTKRELTEEFLADFEVMLADSQFGRYPFAVERLRIHLADSDVDEPAHDPRRSVDLLGLMDDAADEELAPLAEAIRNPQDVIERANDPLQPAAIVVRDFLIAYAAALTDWDRDYRRLAHEWINHSNAGEYEEADIDFAAQRRLVRSIWDARLRLVDQLGALASERIGDDARDAWLHRANKRFCPMIYADDSVDVVISHLRGSEELAADVRAGIEATYDQYLARRNADRPRIARLEITEVGTARLRTAPEPAPATVRLTEANNDRIERADQAHARIKQFLPEAMQAKVDSWVKKHREPVPGTPAHQIKP